MNVKQASRLDAVKEYYFSKKLKEIQKDLKIIQAEDDIIKNLDSSITDCNEILNSNCKQIETILKDDYK